jgi:dihydrofolate reductase
VLVLCHSIFMNIHSVSSDFQQIIHHLQNGAFRDQIDRIWVHGGRDIYAQAMHSSHFYRLYVTRIDAVYEADVFFPPVDWNKLNAVHDDQVPQGVQIDNGTEYSVFVYESNGSCPLIEA